MGRPCRPGEVAATAAVLVSLPGGTRRLMGGATDRQLVVDPITMGSMEMPGEELATLDRD